MSEPNPWSREAADQPMPAPQQQPPPSDDGSQAWPTYPPAPSSTGFEPVESSYPTTDYPANYPAPYAYGTSPYGTSPDGTSSYGPSPYPSGAAEPYPYAASPYGYTATIHPQAVVALVLGVIGLVVCNPAGVAGLLVGRKARKEILAEPQRYSGLGLATAGWILGIVCTVLTVLLVLFVTIGLAGGWDQ